MSEIPIGEALIQAIQGERNRMLHTIAHWKTRFDAGHLTLTEEELREIEASVEIIGLRLRELTVIVEDPRVAIYAEGVRREWERAEGYRSELDKESDQSN